MPAPPSIVQRLSVQISVRTGNWTYGQVCSCLCKFISWLFVSRGVFVLLFIPGLRCKQQRAVQQQIYYTLTSMNPSITKPFFTLWWSMAETVRGKALSQQWIDKQGCTCTTLFLILNEDCPAVISPLVALSRWWKFLIFMAGDPDPLGKSTLTSHEVVLILMASDQWLVTL